MGRTRLSVFFFRQKMRQHHRHRDDRSDRSGQTGNVCAHLTGKDKEVVTEDVEDAACQHSGSRQPRIFVIAQIGGQRLCKQKAGNDKFDRCDIFSGQ